MSQEANQSVTPPESEAPSVEETIARVERLYRAVTGTEKPAGKGAVHFPIPVERDPGEYVVEQMTRLVDLLSAPAPAIASSRAPEGTAPSFSPPLTVTQSEGEAIVRIDLPGVPPDQVEVTANGGCAVTVSGVRPGPCGATPDASLRIRLAEAPSGPFRRTVVLAGALPGALPTARMKDGVLEIRVARGTAPVESPRPVPIAVGVN